MTLGRRLLVCCLLLAGAAPACDAAVSAVVAEAEAGHPIPIMNANVFVTRSSARARIELFAEDLYLFQNLAETDDGRIPPVELKRGLEAHKEFLRNKVTVRDGNGELIASSVSDLQPFEIPADGISIDDLMLHTAIYELEFKFDSPPEFLTLQQDVTDENFLYPSEMKLVLHQAGTELTYTETLLPGKSQTLRLDWSGAVPGNDSDDGEWEAWFEKQRQETLGITSYSSVYSFLYFDPAEVRHEVLVPLATLKTIVPLQHKDPAFIEVSEQTAAAERISEWLKDDNPVTINGQPVAPEFTRVDFYGLNLRDFAQQAEARRCSVTNGRVGIIMTYRLPRQVVDSASVRWDRFHNSLRKIQSVVIPFTGDAFRFEFSRFQSDEENEIRWECPPDARPPAIAEIPAEIPPIPQLEIPIPSVALTILAAAATLVLRRRPVIPVLLLVAAAAVSSVGHASIRHPLKAPPRVDEDTAGTSFAALHRGMYRSLAFGTEERIYDSLASAVQGELLESLYLQLRESLSVREQGGAVARVRDVMIESAEFAPSASGDDTPPWPGFRADVSWVVAGTVEHWGHVHERRNRFTAGFDVRPVNGAWKIVGMTIRDQEQLEAGTRLRGF